jgi:hypothetical protein
MSVLAEVLLALMAIMAVSTVTVVLVARVLYRRVRRSRALNGAVLRARTRMSIGPRHDILRLRLRLRESLDSGQAAIALSEQNATGRGELRRLFRRIQDEGAAVDAQLLLLSTEPDPAELAAALPVAGRRVEQITDLVRRVRSVVAAGLGGRTDDSLSTLGGDVEREIAAMNAGVAELHALNSGDVGALSSARVSPAQVNSAQVNSAQVNAAPVRATPVNAHRSAAHPYAQQHSTAHRPDRGSTP